ncbi:MAG: sugar ABC transporter ATP-binding protein [Spirochaetaceae bacterium]|nr:MAG: sugar ABC transporter ATP-binding protein [Spirochaetaceae bacterium]
MALRAERIVKNYPGVQALKSVDFDLRRGEVHALVGQNGAGKSTLVEIIAGSVSYDSGDIHIGDQKHTYLDPSRSIELGIQTVHQENQLVEEITVAENIFLYDLPRTRYGFVNLRSCIQAADVLLQELGIDVEPGKKISSLSFVDKKLISIAKAFSRKARILILDEPTASLDEQGRNALFSLIRRYTSLGLSTIYISHHLSEIFEIADRVTVLKDGQRVSTKAIGETSLHTIVPEMIGRSSQSLYVRDKKGRQTLEQGSLLQIVDFHREGVVDHVSFSVRAGEVYGIAGLVGAGRTELAQLVFGVDRSDHGSLLLDGKDITAGSPFNAVDEGIGFLTEDRKDSGLVLIQPVYENITLVRFVKEIKKKVKSLLNLAKEQDDARTVVQQLDIRTPTVSQKVINLSGGNQQKVVLGKWLFADSEIIIFDEPTVGIDVGSKSEIYKLIEKLADDGKFIIIISSDNPELVSVCDTVGVMRFGRLVAELRGDQMTEEQIVKHSLGVSVIKEPEL